MMPRSLAGRTSASPWVPWEAMLPLKPPTEEEAFRGQVASAVNDIQTLIQDPTTEKYQEAAAQLLEDHPAVELVAALLNDLTKDSAEQVPVKITPERPLPRRKNDRKGGFRGHGKGNRRNFHRESQRHFNGRRNNHRRHRDGNQKPAFRLHHKED